ncbi:MAG TPA: hypothetical protein DET40_23515 [Lentisphaeria bacterium]|nr:MAG: hypothetical protein A2X45_23730 [Lentisphaerae bacterium GWF2_50_93]HCE46525.1 hypothetical protein [Lentisphaeria bacterium]
MDHVADGKFQEIKVNGWDWSISDPAILDPWFDTWKQVAKKNMVKSSRVRAVFKVENKGSVYFVKYNHPVSLTSKIRSSFVPKSKSEFNSSMLLHEHGIPSIEICGWAKKGSESMLIARELENSVNARTYWFTEACTRVELKEKFLDSFSVFFRSFMSSGFYHPDFHLGNIMVRKDDMSFFLVDPYGVEKKGRLPGSQFFKMVRIIGAFRGEINDREAGEILLKARLAKDFKAANEVWYRILEAEAADVEKVWDKRKLQIITGKGNYCRVFKSCLGQGISIRNSMDGQAMIDNRILMDEKFDESYENERMPEAQAESQWLKSFKLQFHRLAHNMPLAWIKINDTESILVFARKASSNSIKAETVGEFLMRCRAAGIRMDLSRKLAESDGRIYIADYKDIFN